VQFDIRLFDSGQRAAEAVAKQATIDEVKAQRTGRTTEIASEERTAREAVASAERQLARVRAAADRAQEVVDIVNLSFRAGAATSIEVIDDERRARDADNAVAIAEDTLRRARLDLLNARGQFP
jgi:outer membrane protein TolC